MAGLTLAPEGSGSLAKQQLLHELLHLRSGWTQGCSRMSENKQKKGSSRNLHKRMYVYLSNSIQQPVTKLKLRLMGQTQFTYIQLLVTNGEFLLEL